MGRMLHKCVTTHGACLSCLPAWPCICLPARPPAYLFACPPAGEEALYDEDLQEEEVALELAPVTAQLAYVADRHVLVMSLSCVFCNAI